MDSQNLGRAGLQGLTLGWGDEAEALMRAKLLGEGTYDDTLKRIRQEYGQFAEESPYQAGAMEFGAGALTGLAGSGIKAAKTTAGALGRLAGVGAATGAVAGAGSAEEGGRLQGAAVGGVMGAGLGMAIPAVMRGSTAVTKRLRDMVTNNEGVIAGRAAEKMNAAMRESGLTPRQIEQAVAADGARGIPGVVANADPALADLAEAVTQRTGGGARKVEKTLTDQRLGTKERVYQQTNKALKPGNYYDDLQGLDDEMKALSGPAYKQAYAHGEVTDPKVLSFMQLPQFKQGLVEAQKLLAAEGRELDLSKPTVEVLDQVKRGLDNLIEKETDTLTGKTTSLGRIYTQKKSEFLKELDRAVPDYELARGIYAGGAQLKDAMRKGLNEFKSMDHEQVGKTVAKMSDAEKQAFRTGVARDLYGKVMDPSGNFNAAQRVFGSPETQAKLQTLFDNPAEFKLFKAAMERESQLFNQSNKILGGSQTGKRMQMREQLEDSPGLLEAGASAITGGWKSGLTGLVMGTLRSGQMTEKTASKLADMLMSKEPHEVAAVVKMLEDYQKAAIPKAIKAGAREHGAVTGAAAAAGQAPLPARAPAKGELIDDETDDATAEIERDLGLRK